MRVVRAIALRAGAVVVTVVAVLSVLALTGEATLTSYRQTYLQFNMCGNVCSNGGLPVVTALAATVLERQAFAVTLNEVCENQYEQLRADLEAYRGRFDPTGPRCRNGARYGNAILLRATEVTLVGSWELPEPIRHETRRLMCLSTQLPGGPPLVVCVTHISNILGNVEAQVNAVAEILGGLDADAMLLGGDFNTDPSDHRLDRLYRGCDGGGGGLFDEADADSCGNRLVSLQDVDADVFNEPTFGQHKFDYVFLSDGDWSAAAADAGDAAAALSDHDPLWATTVFG